MNLQLSNLLQNQNRISVSGQQQTAGVNTTPVSGNKTLSDFAPGSSLTGQVVETKDGNVTIQLADSSLISASLKDGILLEAGSQVTFLVNSNHNNQIILSPLFTNLDASPNVENALKAADIPITQQTTGMVSDMMEQGMGIDKDSLLAMYKEVNAHPEIDSSMVVKLTQMHLEVNELNASQMETYENFNHQLSGSIAEIADNLQQVFANTEGVSEENLVRLFQGMVDTLTESTETVNSENVQTEQAVPSEVTAENAGELTKGQNISEFLSKNELQSLGNLFREAGGEESAAVSIEKGTVSAKETLQILNRLLQEPTVIKENGTDTATLANENVLQKEQTDISLFKELQSNPAVGKLFREVLQNNWLMEPKEVAGKDKVEAFYEQLKSQTGKLADLAESVLGKDATLTQNVDRLSNQIDFLNQLNQTFTYVQIPLKMSGQDANGDLYVYTNKKSLSSKNGSVSAFLHLDMDHLGSVDVYVTMEKQRVSTNFKVQDDATLDLIESNIDLLNERLQKRGYQLHTTVAKQDEETTVLEEMQKQMGQNSMPIAQFSFDARA
jgi:hypothetical protein